MHCHPKAGRGFVDNVDGFVGQLAVGDITMAEANSLLECIFRVGDGVMLFIAEAQSTQDFDGIFDVRFVYEDRGETPFERRVLFDVLAVFVQCGGADTLQLSARECGLEHVAGVERAGGVAGADDGVQLIHKQYDLALAAADFIHDRLQPFFEFAAEAGPGDHGPQVQRNQTLAGENVRHIVSHDLLGQPFDDGRFADTGFTYQNWIVLRAPTQNLHHARDLFFAADDRIQFPFGGGLRQVAAILFQHLKLAFGVRLVYALASPEFFDSAIEAFLGDACVTQYVCAVGVPLAGDGEQNVFSADIFVLKFICLIIGDAHHAIESGRDENLYSGEPAVGLATTFVRRVEDGFQLTSDDVRGRSEGLQDLGHCSLWLFHQRQEKVFSIDLRMFVLLQNFQGTRGRMLGLLGETVKWHHWCLSQFLVSGSVRKKCKISRN